MGFLDKFLKSAQQPESRTIVFDQDWQDTMQALKIEIEGAKQQFAVSLSFPDELILELVNSIETHSASTRVPYSDEKIPLNNVGESFRQPELFELCDGKPGDEMDWLAGFLIPEILNPYDRTAVAIMAIVEIQGSDATLPVEERFNVMQVGYMDKESAQKVHKKILNLVGKDQYLPLLIRMTGGTKEKPNYGAFPYVMSDKIKFE